MPWNVGYRKAAVHLSQKEIRILQSVGYSYPEIADLLRVSRSHVQRVATGYRCRCGTCPRARSLDELLTVVPRRRVAATHEKEKEGWLSKGLKTVSAIGGLAAFWNRLKSPEGQALFDGLASLEEKEAQAPLEKKAEEKGRIGL